MKNKFHIILYCFLYSTSMLRSQNKSLSATFGFSHNLSKAANGYIIGFNYQYCIKERHAIGFDISSIFTQGRGILPKDLQSSYVFLRDFTNLTPYPWGNQYTLNDFSPQRLKSKPNRFFNLNINIQYAFNFYRFKKHSLQGGFGGIISYFDKMELVDLVKADFNNTFFPTDLKNYYFPVFHFDTFIDIGVISFVTYNYQINQRIVIGGTSKGFWFPKSESVFWSISPSICFKF